MSRDGFLPPGCTQRECDVAQPGYWDEEPEEVCAGCGNHPPDPHFGICLVCVEARCPAKVHRHPMGCPDPVYCCGNNFCFWGCNEPYEG